MKKIMNLLDYLVPIVGLCVSVFYFSTSDYATALLWLAAGAVSFTVAKIKLADRIQKKILSLGVKKKQ